MKKYINKIAYCLLLIIVSCSEKEVCEYVNTNCNMSNNLNLSSGIDSSGNILIPGNGVVDPFWRLINNPPLVSCSNSLASSINGSAYVINYSSSSNTGWVNQPTAGTLAPVDLGTQNSFSCNNASNSQGSKVPYVFERPFCVLNNTTIDFNFTFRGDDQIFFELININTNTVISTSTTYVYPGATASWSGTGISLSAGSYCVRGYLVNTFNVVLGFSFAGNLITTNGDLAISNNNTGCCENNTISVLNVFDKNCNTIFDSGDTLGNGYTFNLYNSSNALLQTKITDINGNIFFSGLVDGNYKVEIVPQATGWYINNPVSGSYSVSVSNNQVKLVEFFNCFR